VRLSGRAGKALVFDGRFAQAGEQARGMRLDTAAWTVEFLHSPYDAGATEAKAALFGYRITLWAERLYTLRRKLLSREP
jgi:hypothetical protein